MNNELTVGTKLALGYFKFSEVDQARIEKCILNYSFEPTTLSERISTKIYKILEALAHLFAMSDRDYAIDAIHRRTSKAPLSQLFSESQVQEFSEGSLDCLIWDQRKKFSNKVVTAYHAAENIDQYVQPLLQTANSLVFTGQKLYQKVIRAIDITENPTDYLDRESIELITKTITEYIQKHGKDIKGFINLVGYAAT